MLQPLTADFRSSQKTCLPSRTPEALVASNGDEKMCYPLSVLSGTVRGKKVTSRHLPLREIVAGQARESLCVSSLRTDCGTFLCIRWVHPPAALSLRTRRSRLLLPELCAEVFLKSDAKLFEGPLQLRVTLTT
jgi:hypothetical protein